MIKVDLEKQPKSPIFQKAENYYVRLSKQYPISKTAVISSYNYADGRRPTGFEYRIALEQARAKLPIDRDSYDIDVLHNQEQHPRMVRFIFDALALEAYEQSPIEKRLFINFVKVFHKFIDDHLPFGMFVDDYIKQNRFSLAKLIPRKFSRSKKQLNEFKKKIEEISKSFFAGGVEIFNDENGDFDKQKEHILFHAFSSIDLMIKKLPL